ncbi:MAG: trypsin-like peptidase domain-containing protein [Desulfobulbaceae bacterium]|nr:trypsin-like peptidase domain-containing protein [Desulfobulbaceae bacterium]
MNPSRLIRPATGIRFKCLPAILIALLLLPGLSHGQDRRSPVVLAVAKAGPAVVNIRTEQIVKRRSTPFFGFSDPFFDQFFNDLGPTRTFKTQALGSGAIIDPRGYVVTNAHVIDKASRIFVALPNQRKELEASLVGKAERLDLAVLKINSAGTYPALPPARSDDLLPGETVIAIGNPLGLGHSITTGIVSAPRRRIAIDASQTSFFIQTDALINPGNSGGPLLNINGELIGINTAIIQQAQGIGFSIPIDVVKRVLPSLINQGKLTPAFLGVSVEELGKQAAADIGGGVLLREPEQGSPAEKVGLRLGDVLTAIDENPVLTVGDFYSILETYVRGNRLRLTILRGFDTLTVQATLAEIPKDYGLKHGEQLFGFSVREKREQVVVDRVQRDSAAQKSGIERGDLIAEVAGEKITTMADYNDAIVNNLGREPLRFLIVRDRRGYYVDLP